MEFLNFIKFFMRPCSFEFLNRFWRIIFISTSFQFLQQISMLARRINGHSFGHVGLRGDTIANMNGRISQETTMIRIPISIFTKTIAQFPADFSIVFQNDVTRMDLPDGVDGGDGIRSINDRGMWISDGAFSNALTSKALKLRAHKLSGNGEKH